MHAFRHSPSLNCGDETEIVMKDIHSEPYVKSLFDEMAKTYGLVNLFSSLGFAYYWRKHAVYDLGNQGTSICDLMTGGAECLTHIKKRFGQESRVHLVDWSEGMCERAQRTVDQRKHSQCEVIKANALKLPCEDCSYDAVVSTFGLKTLAENELPVLAKEIKRVLKPGGAFSLLEFSLPPNAFVRFFFRLYVKYYVPFLGWVFLGNPDNYRMLWNYTKAFSDCREVAQVFEREGFYVEYKSRFFGSATQIIGRTELVPLDVLAEPLEDLAFGLT